MAADARALDPEELLARSGWMRSLVRGIVLDDVDDVVQDAWVAALEHPGAGREPGGLGAWLAAVARNLARRRRRRTALRANVERASARDEHVDGPEEQVARMQLQRLVADAVLALDEPQRSAVILRHLDGCSAAEIARRQSCSVEAARQRVSRGLAQLRVHLDRELGGRANRCLALAPWLAKSWSGALAAGGAVVGAKTVIGITAAAIAAAAVFMVASDDKSTERRAQGASPVTADATPAERGEHASPAVVLAEARAEEPAQAVSAPQPALREALPGTLVARGRVTDTSGNAIEKAELRIDGVTVQSGPDGGFALELAPSDDRSLEGHVEHEGYVPADVTVDPARFLEVRLQRLPALEGLVVHDGRAVAPPGYVKAHVVDANGTSSDHDAELAADGSYRLSGLPPGRLASLEARARGFATARIAPDVELRPDETSARIVELEKGATVTGIVLDAESREPLPHAEVWLETFGREENSVHPSTLADEEGRFRLGGADVDVRDDEDGRFVLFWLMARAEGHVPSPVRTYGSTWSDEHAYDFEVLLERATSELEIRVMLPDGRPASGAMVWAIDAQNNPSFVATDAEGRHHFEGLPAGTMALWLTELEFDPAKKVPAGSEVSFSTTRDGSRPLHALRTELELAPGELRREEFVLRAPEQVVEGRVVDTRGLAVPGVRVEAAFVLQLGGLALSSGSESTLTEADGRYLFDRLHEGKYQVSPSAGEGPTACHLPFDVTVVLVDGEEQPDVDFVVGPCLVLEGRVESRSGTSGLELEARDPRTDERVAGTRPEADGSFAFEALVARDYEVWLVRGEDVLDRVHASPSLASRLVLRVP